MHILYVSFFYLKTRSRKKLARLMEMPLRVQ